jgi:hypothetical protein
MIEKYGGIRSNSRLQQGIYKSATINLARKGSFVAKRILIRMDSCKGIAACRVIIPDFLQLVTGFS